MTAYKSIAVAGGTGNLGVPVVNALLKAGFRITLLTRTDSKSTIPSGATSKPVDYTSVSSLTSALEGQDALVSLVGSTALGTQIALVDAAIAAGVQRFIPSEFGSDTQNEKSSKLPVFGAKVKTQEYLQQKAEEGKISYTIIANGAFLDWGIKVGFLVNTKGGVTRLFDGGDSPFSATTLDSIGQAVVGALSKPDETKNKFLYVQSALVTQNQLLAAAKKVKPEAEFKTEVVSTEEIEKQSYETLKSGQGDIGTAMRGFIHRAIYGKGYGGVYQNPSNELLGVPALSEKDVEELVAQYV